MFVLMVQLQSNQSAVVMAGKIKQYLFLKQKPVFQFEL